MRGGVRIGAGRKPSPITKVTISFKVDEDTRAMVQRLRNNGVDVTTLVEVFIKRGCR